MRNPSPRGGVHFAAKLYYVVNTLRLGHNETMLNFLSIIVGVLAFPVMLIALIPLLGWLNYLVIPLALLGAALGAMSDSNSGRNLNLVVLAVGGVRLWLGGFLI